MTDAPSAVAHFCAALRHLVQAHHVPQTALARALGRSESTISELLSGRRTAPPRVEDVLRIVEYCRRHTKTPDLPGLPLDSVYWRRRHGELEVIGGAEGVEKPRQRPRRPDVDGRAWLEDGGDFAGAVAVLAGRRARLEDFAEDVLAPLALDGSPSAELPALLAHYPGRVRSAQGLDRTVLLCAADVVLHVAAFCETVARAGLTPMEDWGAGPADVTTDVLHELAQIELGSFRVREPAELRAELIASYVAAGDVVSRSATPGSSPPERLAREAMRKYDQLVSEVSWSCPEFRLTSDSVVIPPDEDEPPAPADRTGLGRLGSLLSEFADGGKAPPRSRARLRAPIASVDGSDLVIPTLAEGYVAPSFRFAPRPVDRHLASDDWWERQPLRHDLATFLAAYLLTARATRAPLLVLGHPGSGKSLLTRLLEARLPEREFFCVRVELRHVSADVDVQEQIEEALLRNTGRRTPWPEVVDEASGVVRVVLLDGFDELLQAGAQGRGHQRLWGYLDEIERLQAREAEWGRPTVVVVTSRTVVADRAHLPGTATVMRLEPFGERHITRWLAIWREANRRYFAEQGLEPLTWEVLRPHEELATQPLLLLMLALYDAVGNALRLRRGVGGGRAGLYETLLSEFVRREVVKQTGVLPEAAEAEAVADELRRLGVIATGMFHRGSQSIMATDAERDLAHLLEGETPPLVFGRFFFVHESQAVVAEENLRCYEFLHATFGEHLVARLIRCELDDVLCAHGPAKREPDDRRLRALLSVVPLTDRAEVVRNVRELLASGDEEYRRSLARLLRVLFAGAERDDSRGADLAYRPVVQSAVERDAVYGANLLLIAVAVEGVLDLDAFLSGSREVEDAWSRCAHLWRSQFSDASWTSFTGFLSLSHQKYGSPDSARHGLRIALRSDDAHEEDRAWSAPIRAPRPGGFHSDDERHSVAELVRRMSFLGDADSAELLHVLVPLLTRLSGTLRTYRADGEGAVRSSAHTLMAVLSGDRQAAAGVADAYADLAVMLPYVPEADLPTMRDVLARLLARDAADLPGPIVVETLKALTLSARADSDPGRHASTWRALIDCVHGQVGRPDVAHAELDTIISRLGTLLRAADSHARLAAALGQAETTHVWHRVTPSPADEILDRHAAALPDVPSVERPRLTVELLRLARELGRVDWLAEHAEPLLLTLDLAALGRLRPTDVDALMPLVHDTALVHLLDRIRVVWRGRPMPPPDVDM
ncbi:helix-turn-helix domain-containing protein [Streptomyces sp. NPDC101160]|uniref:NACHT N-terminal helical domain 7-containing protein n=1 Tax=Streptomyces sp. NPDC101160 TaxID=3366118 RepID=UPI003808FCD0